MLTDKNFHEIDYSQIDSVCFQGTWINVNRVQHLTNVHLGDTYPSMIHTDPWFHDFGEIGPCLRIETPENEILYLKVNSITGLHVTVQATPLTHIQKVAG